MALLLRRLRRPLRLGLRARCWRHLHLGHLHLRRRLLQRALALKLTFNLPLKLPLLRARLSRRL